MPQKLLPRLLGSATLIAGALGLGALALAMALGGPGGVHVPALCGAPRSVSCRPSGAPRLALLARVPAGRPGVDALAAIRAQGFDGLAPDDPNELRLGHPGCSPDDPDTPVPAFRAPLDDARAALAHRGPGPVTIVLPGPVPSGGTRRLGPDDAEYKVAAFGALALGADSLVTPLDPAEAARAPGLWSALAQVNADLAVIRELACLGVPTGLARATEPDVLVQALRSPDAIVLPVVNLRVQHAVDALRCRREPEPHWLLADIDTDVTLTVPPDLGLEALAEVVEGRLQPVRAAASIAGREVTLHDVRLTGEHPCRLFVLARTDEVLQPLYDAGGPR